MTSITAPTATTTLHVCDCAACGGFAFTAPAGYITGTAKDVQAMVHNYAQMVQSPALGAVMAARGLRPAR